MNVLEKTKENCIHCKRCTKACDFLSKYGMDLSDFANRPDLRYSCFLCGKCNDVCPVDLDGKEISLFMRRKNPKGLKFVKFMKNNYKLRNIGKKKSKDLIFLGCNYPGFLPKTSEKIIEIGYEHGADFSVDCCKRPTHDMGGEAPLEILEKNLKSQSVERIICLCPNCYHFLTGKIYAEVISVYEYLREIGVGKKIDEACNVFFPCSDRYSREIFEDIKYFTKDYEEPFTSIGCCGLGGGAIKQEGDVVDRWKEKMNSLDKEFIYTYCSSCAGIFHNGYKRKNVKNFLTEILEVEEEPSEEFAKNVMKFKFKKHRR